MANISRLFQLYLVLPMLVPLGPLGMGFASAQDVSQAPMQQPTAQGGHDAAASGPGGIDPALTREFSLQQLLGNLPQGAMESSPGGGAPPQAAGPNRYLHTTLRVVNASAPRGCGYADWNCMTNLCRADLGSASWRGWAGCHRSNGSWICYFECGLVEQVF